MHGEKKFHASSLSTPFFTLFSTQFTSFASIEFAMVEERKNEIHFEQEQGRAPNLKQQILSLRLQKTQKAKKSSNLLVNLRFKMINYAHRGYYLITL